MESSDSVELTILMPCLNEAQTLARCIDKAKEFLAAHGVRGEILIADNNSTDGSQEVATAHGARVEIVKERGYGAALMGGIHAARGRYIIMGDADDSYDFLKLAAFLEKLREGYALVMGNRFKGGIMPGAMPALHRYLGNPVLTFIGRLLFGSPCGDFHCGLRGFNRAAILALDLRTEGMEFASEMVVKATLAGLSITEVPTTLAPDGRSRPPHLHSWRDGWRHLRFMLMCSPKWLFIYPGLLLLLAGVGGHIWLLPGPRTIGGVTFDVHTLLFAGVAVIVGAQMLLLGWLAQRHAIKLGLYVQTPLMLRMERLLTLEHLLVLGLVLALCGLSGAVISMVLWSYQHFGPLDYTHMIRIIAPSCTALVMGVQLIFGAFLAGITGMPVRGRNGYNS